MIFDLTQEEDKVLEPYGEAYADALMQFVYSDDHATLKRTAGEIKRDFIKAYSELEDARFSKLETNEEILEDAKRQTRSFIEFSYTMAFLSEKKEETNIFKVGRPSEILNPLSYYLVWYSLELIKKIEEGAIDYGNGEKAEANFNCKLEFNSLRDAIKKDLLARHFSALEGTPEGQQLKTFIDNTLSRSKYVTKEKTAVKVKSLLNKTYIPSFYGPFRNKLVLSPTAKQEKDEITRKTTFTTDEKSGVFKITVTAEGLNKVREEITKNGLPRALQRQKLFDAIVLYFTVNHEREINISLEDYLTNIGKNVVILGNDDAATIKKKKNLLKSSRRHLKSDLDMLSTLQYRWTGKKKENRGDFVIVNMFEGVSIKNGYIRIKLTETMADALADLPLMQYPTVLLSTQNDNAYAMGYSIAHQYAYYRNGMRGTNDRLKVSTLLKATNLPTLKDLEKEGEGRHWEKRIKEPFEKCLEELVRIGYLKSWEYCEAKGVELEEAKAYNITSFNIFSNLYVKYEPEEIDGHAEKLKELIEEREKAIRNRQPKKKGRHKKETS